MTNDELIALQRKIEQSEPLSRMADQLQTALADRAAAAGLAGFSPMLIIGIISIIIQIVHLCRQQNSETFSAGLIRDLPNLDGRRTLRLRRRLNKMWAEYCSTNNIPHTKENPLLAAALSLSAQADEATIQALLEVSDAAKGE
jgi:hypothetical protein